MHFLLRTLLHSTRMSDSFACSWWWRDEEEGESGELGRGERREGGGEVCGNGEGGKGKEGREGTGDSETPTEFVSERKR